MLQTKAMCRQGRVLSRSVAEPKGDLEILNTDSGVLHGYADGVLVFAD